MTQYTYFCIDHAFYPFLLAGVFSHLSSDLNAPLMQAVKVDDGEGLWDGMAEPRHN